MKLFRTQYLSCALVSIVACTPLLAKQDQPKKKSSDKANLAKTVKPIKSAYTLDQLQDLIYLNEPKCRAASVGISTSFGAQGSGVIVSKEGILLTAAHVVGELGTESTIILANGKRYKMVTLLFNAITDTAICKIVDPMPEGGFPFRPLRTEKDLVAGDWCTVIANGGGIQSNRPAPVRIGRVLVAKKDKQKNALISDCTVTSGDSGGPLFDMHGNIAGINSAVGAGSALNNIHMSSNTYIQQWGDYLIKNKPLPTVAEARAKETARKIASGDLKTSIPKPVIPVVKKAFAKQYPSFNEKALNLLLENATMNGGQVKIQATPKLRAALKKLGIDPAKHGFGVNKKEATKEKLAKEPKEESKPKVKERVEDKISELFGEVPDLAMYFLKTKHASSKNGQIDLNNKDLEILRKLGVDTKEIRLELAIRKRFGKVSKEAMTYLKKRFKRKPNGNYKLEVTKKDILALSNLGVDIIDKETRKKQLTQMFKKQYGKDIKQEAIDLLLRATILDKKTGRTRLNLDAGMLSKLSKLGVNIKTGKDEYLIPLEFANGDSAKEIGQYFPEISTAILLLQNGDSIGQATAITADGRVITKSSSIKKGAELTAQYQGKTMKVNVIARDKKADLALLQVALPSGKTFRVTPWATDSKRGQLLVTSTDKHKMLGVVSVPKRIIPEKTMGIGNGNKAILGVVSDINKKVDGSYITKVHPKTPAAKGGIKKGDIITAVGGNKIGSQVELRKAVSKYKGGDQVMFSILRGEKSIDLLITLQAAELSDMFSTSATNNAAQDLSALAGELSPRRSSFPEAFSHDALIWNDDCGGPVYSLDGKLLGINIARYSRITSYALTEKSVKEALERMSVN